MGSELGTGWRVARGLAALAGAVVVLVVLVVVLTPDARDPASSLTLHPAVMHPWAACARTGGEQLGVARDVSIAGPLVTRWDESGEQVDLTGRATRSGHPQTQFGCHVSRVDGDWQVDQLVVAGP